MVVEYQILEFSSPFVLFFKLGVGGNFRFTTKAG